MTSNCDVTNSAPQIQMTTLCHWMKRLHENFLRTPLSVTNRFYLLLLHHSLEYCTYSVKLALIKAITSLQQCTHKLNVLHMGVSAVCVLIYICLHCKIIFLYHNCSMTIFLRPRIFFNNLLQKNISRLGFSK